MKRRVIVALCAAHVLVPAWFADSAVAASIQSARRDITRLRYDLAESKLVDIAKTLSGERRQEALYLLAGLKSSASEAEIIYQEVIRLHTGGEWAAAARVELAKIQYALGNYGKAFEILESSQACGVSEEACFFQGMSAVMSKSYARARTALQRVRRGKYRPWAYLSLADIEMNTHNVEEACRRYRAIARTAISPTAMYRYAECLEKQGSGRDARRAFEEVIAEFKNTPEALLAGQKLERMTEHFDDRSQEKAADEGRTRPKAGYTIQFGAFHDRTNAIKLAASLKRDLPGIRVDSGLVNNREIHRVRYGYFETREAAERTAEQIATKIDERVSILPLP
ncbi:MAG: SPOR domain-containing protein [Candidatus Krumholzibacteriia bacterium]